MKRILLLAAWCSLAAQGATLTLSNGGALHGLPDEVVGWGFSLTSTEITDSNGTYTPWMLVTSVDFVPDGGQLPVGVFTPYLTLFPNFLTVIGPDTGNGEVNPWAESFDAVLQRGLGEYHINSFQSLGDQVVGRIIVTFDLFRKSPNEASFDPSADAIDFGLSVSAAASVMVGDTATAPVPEPGAGPLLGLLLISCGIGRWTWGSWRGRRVCRRPIA